MANLKEVKGRIKSVTSTQQITKAMKMVAAAKLRKAQDRIMQMRPYSQKLSSIISNVTSVTDPDEVENPYSENRHIYRVLLIVITSDRGLCGAFNSNAFKHTAQLIKDYYSYHHRTGDLEVMPIGKRSYDYFKKRDYHVVEGYHEIFQNLSFEKAREAAQYAMDKFEDGTYDKVEIIYNEFKNVATQIVKNESFLPIAEPEQTEESKYDYIFEPSKEFLFSEVIPNSLKVQLYKAILESNASEHGARMTAMDQATDNADELLKELKLTYNRTRQAAITKEILEIVGGAEALSQSS